MHPEEHRLHCLKNVENKMQFLNFVGAILLVLFNAVDDIVCLPVKMRLKLRLMYRVGCVGLSVICRRYLDVCVC